MRSQFDTTQKDPLDEEFSLGPNAIHPQRYIRDVRTDIGNLTDDTELDVHVRVQRSVTVDYNPGAYERESYRIPRRAWDSTTR